jgi:hypothetical protein
MDLNWLAAGVFLDFLFPPLLSPILHLLTLLGGFFSRDSRRGLPPLNWQPVSSFPTGHLPDLLEGVISLFDTASVPFSEPRYVSLPRFENVRNDVSMSRVIVHTV